MSQTCPDDPRRAALMSAAAELFLERGFAATSIDAIIERAGGSKRTIYALFGNKEGLFEALVADSTAKLYSGVFHEEDADKAGLEGALTQFAEHLLELFSQPRAIGLYRLVVSEAGRSPELVSYFFRTGPAKSLDWVKRLLQAAHARGEIVCPDPELTASQFLGLVRGETYLTIVLGQRPPLTEQEIPEMARQATQIFLWGLHRENASGSTGKAEAAET
ncbi:TetR/AcrR family transcriptional regulator [uncultured Martelella sp.]|uniref:TetR/AcrR family transcriptional regulator n=1 Tax=uncultured Martelella sp. TaxID=392331 RepID=UPI0029C84513|nr:TetR/AcrR family transcriptional regulator [uncultured Martelella sp.]